MHLVQGLVDPLELVIPQTRQTSFAQNLMKGMDHPYSFEAVIVCGFEYLPRCEPKPCSFFDRKILAYQHEHLGRQLVELQHYFAQFLV